MLHHGNANIIATQYHTNFKETTSKSCKFAQAGKRDLPYLLARSRLSLLRFYVAEFLYFIRFNIVICVNNFRKYYLFSYDITGIFETRFLKALEA